MALTIRGGRCFKMRRICFLFLFGVRRFSAAFVFCFVFVWTAALYHPICFSFGHSALSSFWNLSNQFLFKIQKSGE
jgi:hypothetical protein